MQPDLEGTAALIRYWHRLRCAHMEARKRSDLSLGAFLRVALGWSKALPDADRKRIANQAQVLIEMGEAEARGKPVETDEPAYLDYRESILAFIKARAPHDANEKRALKEMEKLAKTLPAWEGFAKDIRGFGAASLAVIVAEAGDLTGYGDHSKLWKRMGLAVLDGVRQGGLRKGAAKEDWIAHGYSAQRRSRMWNIGDALVKGNRDGVYRTLYLERKGFEAGRAPEMTPMQAHRRAQRYMEKRLLRDLWRAWRDERGVVVSMPEGAKEAVPSALPNEGEAKAVLPHAARDGVPTPHQDEQRAMSSLPEKASDTMPSVLPFRRVA